LNRIEEDPPSLGSFGAAGEEEGYESEIKIRITITNMVKGSVRLLTSAATR
jgi:hypothetical protein